MKKILSFAIVALISAGMMNAAFADVPKKLGFAPVGWQSVSAGDMKVIVTGGHDAYATAYNVLINVFDDFPTPGGKRSAGINIQNCEGVSHLNPGDSAICKLHNSVITLASDSDQIAHGTYQIEKA